ncbi:52 kDa repressor of the inhibitor of the protein kinase [Plecturocebus cupreus]
MEYRRGQAYIVSSGFSSKMKVVASRLLEKQLDDVISILSQNSKERGKELKEICHCQWTGRHDASEILIELLQALVLCLDGIKTGRASVLCSGVTDFDFIVTVAVLKNVLSFTRAFGENVQEQTSHVLFAAGSLTAVLR